MPNSTAAGLEAHPLKPPNSAKKKGIGLGLKIAAPGPRTASDTLLDSAGNVGGLAPPPRPIELPRSNKLDVKVEDLEMLEELGSGNGGTVNRVRYKPTGAIMARKVGLRGVQRRECE